MNAPSSDAPLVRRFVAYLAERFPLPPYALLVALFFGSAVAVARALGVGPEPTWRTFLGAPVVLLVFFHLRVFDEHKDFARDVRTHPDRLLSKGVVTLPFLFRAGLVAIALEALLSAAVGVRALVAWAVCAAFTLAMRYEFGAGAWLGRRIVAYAIAHNPIAALLSVYAWACTGAAWRWEFGWYAGAVTFGTLAFEVGRKTRLEHEEVAGVESYSVALGRRGAAWLLVALVAGATACALGAMLATRRAAMGPYILLVAGACVGGALASPRVAAKVVEQGASLFLLLAFAAMGWNAW